MEENWFSQFDPYSRSYREDYVLMPNLTNVSGTSYQESRRVADQRRKMLERQRDLREFEFDQEKLLAQLKKVKLPPSLQPKPKVKTEQEIIDEAIRASLAKAKIEAEEQRIKDEIQRRAAIVEKVGAEDKHELGTVIRWTRRIFIPSGEGHEYAYVAIKIEDGYWMAVGTISIKNSAQKWEELLKWMMTGDNTAENIQVATGWNKVT